jgi:hypothetical protein
MLDLMGLDNNKNKSPPTENITLVKIIYFVMLNGQTTRISLHQGYNRFWPRRLAAGYV